MQGVRQPTDIFRDGEQAFLDFLGMRLLRAAQLSAQGAEFDRDRRERLADVVVQVARASRTRRTPRTTMSTAGTSST